MTDSRAISFRFLSQEDVIACGGLDARATIAAVETALQLLAGGNCVEPPVSLLHWGEPHRRRMTAHLAYVGGEIDAAGIKWIGSNPDNPDRIGMPRATGFFALTDPATGHPLAIMDGTVISAMRTGAVVGAAARRLVQGEPRTVAVIGAGVIARTQLLALCAALPTLTRAVVFDIDRARTARFVEDLAPELGLQFEIAKTARDATQDAEIVAPATNVGTHERYIERSWLKPGAFLANVSLNDYRPDVVEACARIVVDTREQLNVRGLLLADMVANADLDPAIVDELGSLLCGDPGHVRQGDFTMFSPIGLGIEDVINAHRIYQEAARTQVGQMLRLWNAPIWC